jgi:hypothetical protein
LNRQSAIGVYSGDSEGTCCSRFKLIREIREFQNLITNCIVIGITFDVSGNEPLGNQLLSTLLQPLKIRYQRLLRIMSLPKAKPPGVVFNVLLYVHRVA